MSLATGSSPRTWFARAMEPLWLAVAVAVPLAFNPWGTSAFELPKAVLLRALVLLVGLVALVGFFEGRSSTNRAQLPLPARSSMWAALVFGGALALATVLSIDPRASLWGSYERQQGLLTWSAYLALFLLTAANLRTRAQAERLWAALVWSSVPVVAYGLVQAMGLDPLDWQTDAASPVLSTIGRANFLGSYLVLVIPLTAERALSPRHRWLHLLLLGGQLACLALTQARGAWVGMGVTAVVGLLAWAVATRSRRLAIAALAPVILAVGLVALLNLPNNPLASLAQLPGLDRIAALTDTEAGSTAARLTIWRATLSLIVDHPWLGYGPETMRPVFLHIFPPQLVYYQGRHATVDRAHNLLLDLGMSAGLAGIAAFGALLLGVGRTVRHGLRGASDRRERLQWTALAAALAGHLTDLLFGFDLTASGATFWLVLALGVALGRRLAPPARERIPQKPSALLTYIPPALAILALIGLICLRPLVADIAFWKSQQDARPPKEQLAAGERAILLWPLEPEYRLGLAWLLARNGDFAAAETQLTEASRLSPDDPRVWAVRGDVYALWGEIASGQYLYAESAYRKALELAPNVATFHRALGLVLVQQGQYKEGVAELEQAVALDATDGVAFHYLADLYHTLGQENRAAWARKEAQRWDKQ